MGAPHVGEVQTERENEENMASLAKNEVRHLGA